MRGPGHLAQFLTNESVLYVIDIGERTDENPVLVDLPNLGPSCAGNVDDYGRTTVPKDEPMNDITVIDHKTCNGSLVVYGVGVRCFHHWNFNGLKSPPIVTNESVSVIVWMVA